MRKPLIAALVGCASSSQVAAPTTGAPPVPTAQAKVDELLPAPGYLTSSRIAALDGGALVIDADSGVLVRTNRDGDVVARLTIGRDAGTLACDPVRRVVFVADRVGDRIVAADSESLRVVATWPTPAEPFGVALTPDRSTLLVATVADRTLVAFDARLGRERWRAALAYEPRAIAIAPDATRALVTAGSGGLDEVALVGAHQVSSIALPLDCDRCASGPAFARGGAVMFLDQYRAIASFQRAVPEAIEMFSADRYSGGSLPPITQHLDFLSFAPGATSPGQTVAQVAANQPRSIAWDRERDTLWVAGLAADALLRLRGLTHATTGETEAGAGSFQLRTAEPCGPDGLALASDGTMYLWCSFSRRIVRVTTSDSSETALHEGDPIAESSLSGDAHRGLVLFQSVQRGINADGAIACATCHIDGRSDGHSWKLHEQTLQTPSLAGRVIGTAPYKWDGSDRTIQASIASTVHRLGGRGLSAAQTASLVAYVDALPRPHPPTLDAAAVARGQLVFEADGGCTECHDGPKLTDTRAHRFDGSALVADTPSLIGLAATAPYYHDGSAPTLDALVGGGGSVHGMGNLAGLSPAQRADLVAFLAAL